MPPPRNFFKSLLTQALRPPNLFLNVAKSAVIVHLLLDHVGAPAQTYGPSMLPTLRLQGDWIWISKKYRRGKGVVVGDIVSFRHPLEVDVGASKRVLGMPGDFVLMASPDKPGDDQMIQVPQGHCWLSGDNSPWSYDSRDYGPVPLALIIGKVVGVVLPFSERRWLENSLHPAASAEE